jgi:IrrE N-terminal-like domain
MKESLNLPNPTLAAEKLLAKAGIGSAPVDLSKVISLWPNLFLVEEDLEGSGYLLSVGELGAEILVNKADREERKRFTVAHELGHWVLGLSSKRKMGHFSQPKHVRYTQIEKWCDSFATNLLMPEAIVRSSLNQTDPMLVIDAIARAASRFKVSEEAFYIRAWEVLRLQIAFLQVSTVSGLRKVSLERSFADSDAESFLADFLERSPIGKQAQSQPFVYFHLQSDMGKIRCVGRNMTPERMFMVLKWPDERSA